MKSIPRASPSVAMVATLTMLAGAVALLVLQANPVRADEVGLRFSRWSWDRIFLTARTITRKSESRMRRSGRNEVTLARVWSTLSLEESCSHRPPVGCFGFCPLSSPALCPSRSPALARARKGALPATRAAGCRPHPPAATEADRLLPELAAAPSAQAEVRRPGAMLRSAAEVRRPEAQVPVLRAESAAT